MCLFLVSFFAAIDRTILENTGLVKLLYRNREITTKLQVIVFTVLEYILFLASGNKT